ncbi:MAG: AAA family ATPase, partial [Desulfobacterales bacterium]
MYCTYYKFSEKPFDVTPDPRFLYLTEGYRETLASIVYGIRERRGFITIIGEVGTGKTTLLNAAMDRMDEKTRVAFIFNTDVTFDQMLNMALYEWGLIKDNETVSKVDAIQRLNRFAIEQLRIGGNVVLIVDEAQNLDNNVMENLRLLSNLETRRHKLIQIVLSGQPELYLKLSRHELRQLAQRISLKRYVSPLDEKDTYAYLQHRLKVVQDTGTFPFTPKAQKLIWEYSKGVPRKINILCDNAFLVGYALEIKTITEKVVWEAVQDLEWRNSSDKKAPWEVPLPESPGFTWVKPRPRRRSFKLTAAMVTAGILILAGGVLINNNPFNAAKLTGFIGRIRNTAPQAVRPEPVIKKIPVSPPVVAEQTAAKSDIKTQKIPEENPEPETRTKNADVSYLTLSKYHLMKEKSPDQIIQDYKIENTTPETAIKENEPFDIQDKDRKTQDISVSGNQADGTDKSGTAEPVEEGETIR